FCKAIRKAPNTKVIAIGSRSLEKATSFSSEQGLPEAVRVYGSYEAVLENDEVDAVYIPLPTALHVTWAVKAAEKGKHVLLEKPVAMNVAELDQILEACEMAEKTEVRFGILGCAQISIKFCKAIRKAPNAKVIAIGSRSLEKATSFASEQGLPEAVSVYGSYEAVLENDEVDAVYIPLPTALHVTWAVKAAEKGKHVLLEKPVAMNVAELDQILEACE
ncbi:hypothetical protein RYX36_009594, partial [Vicia faba]